MERTAIEIRPLDHGELDSLEQHINFDWAAANKHGERLIGQELGRNTYLVAWRGRLPVGHGLIKGDGSDEEPIASRLTGCPDSEDLFVVPDCRSTGIGSLLLEVAEDLAVRKGFGQIGLGVDITNTRARSLYAGRGYEDTGLEYRTKNRYEDQAGQGKWWEENCRYLMKRLNDGRAATRGRLK